MRAARSADRVVRHAAVKISIMAHLCAAAPEVRRRDRAKRRVSRAAHRALSGSRAPPSIVPRARRGGGAWGGPAARGARHPMRDRVADACATKVIRSTPRRLSRPRTRLRSSCQRHCRRFRSRPKGPQGGAARRHAGAARADHVRRPDRRHAALCAGRANVAAASWRHAPGVAPSLSHRRLRGASRTGAAPGCVGKAYP